MRIITGTAKGMKLFAPHGLNVRPTTDRVKESVFNILAGSLSGSTVLDIFSGTGNLALEALSRGAATAVMVDKSAVSISFIKKNAVATRLSDRVRIIKQDVAAALDRLAAEGCCFDLIFCDPPYNKGFVQIVLQKLEEHPNLLSEHGMAVIEHSGHEPIPESEWLSVLRTQQYGETHVTFLEMCRI